MSRAEWVGTLFAWNTREGRFETRPRLTLEAGTHGKARQEVAKGVRQKERQMTAKKKAAGKKLQLRKQTLKDLDVRRGAGGVKGGTLKGLRNQESRRGCFTPSPA